MSISPQTAGFLFSEAKIFIALNSYSETKHQIHCVRFQTMCNYAGQGSINMEDLVHKTC